jgi:hypothetical protein
MTYTVTGIAELVEYYLVASAPAGDAANLTQLVQKLELLAPWAAVAEVSWVFCDRCGCSADTDLIDPDGHRYAVSGPGSEVAERAAPADGDFLQVRMGEGGVVVHRALDEVLEPPGWCRHLTRVAWPRW